MHNIVLVEHLEGINKLFEDEQSLFFCDDFVLPKETLKCTPVAVLIYEVEIVGCFKHIDVLDDVLILLDIGKDVDLVYGAFLQFFVLFESAHLDDFDRVFLAVQLVYGPVDLSVGPLTYYLIECVVLNNPDHRCRKINNYYKASESSRELGGEGGRRGGRKYYFWNLLIKIFNIALPWLTFKYPCSYSATKSLPETGQRLPQQQEVAGQEDLSWREVLQERGPGLQDPQGGHRGQLHR